MSSRAGKPLLDPSIRGQGRRRCQLWWARRFVRVLTRTKPRCNSESVRSNFSELSRDLYRGPCWYIALFNYIQTHNVNPYYRFSPWSLQILLSTVTRHSRTRRQITLYLLLTSVNIYVVRGGSSHIRFLYTFFRYLRTDCSHQQHLETKHRIRCKSKSKFQQGCSQ